mmetsp:Transcript_55572/g.176446  ORF Transcript_55572/g.176446 Transcript_55572/m.176446 type:complete len:264 (+) Transcript_55572:239-1030(+)
MPGQCLPSSTERCSCSTTAARRTLTSATMRGSWTSRSGPTTTSPPARSTSPSSSASAAATTSARLCRWCLISQTQSRTGLSALPTRPWTARMAPQTCASSSLAAPWETSSRCPSSRRSASSSSASVWPAPICFSLGYISPPRLRPPRLGCPKPWLPPHPPCRQGQHVPHPRIPRARARGVKRAEDKAHAALGHDLALPRPRTRPPRRPQHVPPGGVHPREAGALLPRDHRPHPQPPRRVQHLARAAHDGGAGGRRRHHRPPQA